MPPVMASPGQIALTVVEAHVAKWGGSSTAWANTGVYLRVTISNGAGAPAIAMNPALFAITDGAGISEVASTDAYFTAGSQGYNAESFLGSSATVCDPSVSVNAGASYTCTISASFNGDVVPASVQYFTPAALAGATVAGANLDNRKASGNIPTTTCTPCGAVCTDITVDQYNCGACGTDIRQSTATCVAGLPSCPAEDGSAASYCKLGGCLDLQTSPSNCGACGTFAPNGGSCVGGKGVCAVGQTPCATTCTTPPCQNDCVDPTTDAANCGGCGNKCATGQFCGKSTCLSYTPATSTAGTCAATCQALGKTCVEQCYVDYYDGASTPCSSANWTCAGNISNVEQYACSGFGTGNPETNGVVECSCE